MAGKTGFDPPKKKVSADFGRKTWFWSISAAKSGFARFSLEKLVFNWSWSILTEKTGFGQFWPKNVILVDSGSFGVF